MGYTKKELKENRRKWIEALRSKKYVQATAQLRSSNGFCCLGVLCEVLGVQKRELPHCGACGIHKDECECEGYIRLWGYGQDDDTELCPREAMNLVGLNSVDGYLNIPIDDQCSLASLNDCGKSFLEIADIIESEPEGLFL